MQGSLRRFLDGGDRRTTFYCGILISLNVHYDVFHDRKDSGVLYIKLSKGVGDDCQALQIPLITVPDRHSDKTLETCGCRLSASVLEVSKCAESISDIKLLKLIMMLHNHFAELIEELGVIVIQGIEVPQIPASLVH